MVFHWLCTKENVSDLLVFDSLSVAENVGFSLYEHSSLSSMRIRELVSQSLARVGLAGIEDRYPAELSGGMRKRVSIARAITSNPDDESDSSDIILYDEPTAGLDPIASTKIENLIRELHDERPDNTTIVVTHQDSTLRRTTDRIVFLYRGQAQWEGSVRDFDHTENPFIRQFRTASLLGPMDDFS
mmetsp:Transcript_44716/g.72786  ORF Transcript_44716/g.72786 Transcript_44716/m.72786 type:complete len:186 (-) Transcript_44716:280-837(-)